MKFEKDLIVIGAGRIGLPWAAVMAHDCQYKVTCLDINEEKVNDINRRHVSSYEPKLQEILDTLDDEFCATTDYNTIPHHSTIGITVDAERGEMYSFLDIIHRIGSNLVKDQLVLLRTTLPVGMVSRAYETFLESSGLERINFAAYPERIAEGKAIEEIRTLPHIVGVYDGEARKKVEDFLRPLNVEVLFTYPETAMFVKLIDNAYRDATFAISNQIALIADLLGLDSHEAIRLANYNYPRNDIPPPGTVGGKCLTKDPHFLMDSQIAEQPTTPDLFAYTRKTNAYLPHYIATRILGKKPRKVAILGLAYKREVGDTCESPSMEIAKLLESYGVEVSKFDPYIHEESKLKETVEEANVVLLAVNHSYFKNFKKIEELCSSQAEIYDIWGIVNPEETKLKYNGLGRESR